MLSDYETSGTQTRKLCMLPSALGEGEGGAGQGGAWRVAWRSVDWLVFGGGVVAGPYSKGIQGTEARTYPFVIPLQRRRWIMLIARLQALGIETKNAVQIQLHAINLYWINGR